MSALEVLRRALEARDGDLIRDAADQLWHEMLDYAGFPAELFNGLIEAISHVGFADTIGSYRLLSIFEVDRHKLSPDQRDTLTNTLAMVFPCFRDEMGYLYTTEILTEIATPQRALEVLQRLALTENEAARSYVPHGLSHLIEASDDESVTQDARALLDSLRRDKCERVRAEAELYARSLP